MVLPHGALLSFGLFRLIKVVGAKITISQLAWLLLPVSSQFYRVGRSDKLEDESLKSDEFVDLEN